MACSCLLNIYCAILQSRNINTNAGKIRHTQKNNKYKQQMQNIEVCLSHVAVTEACLYFPVVSPQQGCYGDCVSLQDFFTNTNTYTSGQSAARLLSRV